MENKLPRVSIIIPCRNEEKFIGPCLDSLIKQDYPKEKLEILVMNGMSTDKTKEVVENYHKKYDFIAGDKPDILSKLTIKIIDNPNKTSPCALNLGIKNSTGEIVMHMGAHATYQPDYVSKSVNYLIKYNADNVGGILLTLPASKTLMAKAITLALSNKFGTGNSYFRLGFDKPKWVDTVFGGCYKKETVVKIGMYNEKLTRSQDMELNMRLHKAGGKILLAPDIVGHYYPKTTFNSFFKHNIDDGIWAVYPIKFGAPVFTIRHFIPLSFILILVGTAILGIFLKIFWWFLLLEFIVYLGTSKIVSIKIALKEKNLRLVAPLVAAFFARHFGYGIGSLIGLIKLVLPAEK